MRLWIAKGDGRGGFKWRLSTGIARLDDLLGGGLLPGTLAAVVGSTGIGKTQLGLQFAHAGAAQRARPASSST